MTTERPPLAPLPERMRLFAHLVMASMVLTWVVSALPYPWRFATVLVSAAGVAFAIFALVASKGVPRVMFLRYVIIAAGAMASVSMVTSAVSLVVAPELIELSQCEQRAITSQAEQQCQQEFLDAVEERLPLMRDRS